jgi:hypothetical protein
MKRLNLSPFPSEASMTAFSTPSTSPASAQRLSSSSSSSNQFTFTNSPAKPHQKAYMRSFTCFGFASIIAIGLAFYGIFLLTINRDQLVSMAPLASVKSSIFRSWIESLAADSADSDVNEARTTYLQAGINNILKNYSALVVYDPFSMSNNVNVWDLYPPSISCPDIKRIGRVGKLFIDHRSN